MPLQVNQCWRKAPTSRLWHQHALLIMLHIHFFLKWQWAVVMTPWCKLESLVCSFLWWFQLSIVQFNSTGVSDSLQLLGGKRWKKEKTKITYVSHPVGDLDWTHSKGNKNENLFTIRKSNSPKVFNLVIGTKIRPLESSSVHMKLSLKKTWILQQHFLEVLHTLLIFKNVLRGKSGLHVSLPCG